MPSAEPPAPSSSEKPFNVAIIGGGIGGLCLAIGLLHRKIPIKVYEQAPAFAEIGAGVAFAANSISAMTLIDPDIYKGYKNVDTGNGWNSKKDSWFDFRKGMKGDKEGEMIHALKLAKGKIQSSVHRAHFLDELIKLVPEETAVFGKHASKVEQKNGKVQVTFGDGDEIEADLVIACDGVKSTCRKYVAGDCYEPTFTGKYAYKGLIPMEKAVDAIGDEQARNSQMYLGKAGHVLTFPIEQGKTMNVVAFSTKEDGKWEDDRWVLPMQKEHMYADFEGWGKDVHSILGLIEKPDLWALFDHPPAPTYIKGNLCLLGDGAHAATPHLGAGAGQAIEDALILSHVLGLVQTPKDLPSALKSYDTMRRERSQGVVTCARQQGVLYDMQDPDAGEDTDRIAEVLDKRLRWIWDVDLKEELEKAGVLFEKEKGMAKL